MNIELITQPIIITCKLDDNATAFFNELRQQHFPPAKNLLKAHLTLFHHILLPADKVLVMAEKVTSHTKPLNMLAERIAFTGRGVAVVIKSPELVNLHKVLQQTFQAMLTPQDRQLLWPHVTIQNKTSVNKSKALAVSLQEKFEPFVISAAGLQLFWFMNGPWKFIADADFK